MPMPNKTDVLTPSCCEAELTGIERKSVGDVFAALVDSEIIEHAGRYRAYGVVLDRDASDSLAAIELVLAQSSISSQLIDNLNASIHLRALLTDLFLIDEILKPQPTAHPSAAHAE